jgi:serpin B
MSGTETDNPMGPTGQVPDGVELRRSQKPYLEAADAPAADREALRDSNLAFALALYREAASRAEETDNLLLGVHSVTSVLAMTLAGAATDTEAEIAAALQLTLLPADLHPAMNALGQALRQGIEGTAVRYDALNSIWLGKNHTIADPFLDILSQHYDTGTYLVDFDGNPAGARTSINDWVADQTGGLIEELFGPNDIDSNTQLALTNAAYLSAPWQDHFDPDKTWSGEFTLPDGNVVDVPLMDRNFGYPHAFTVGWRALELPFRDADMGMVFVLPNEGEFDEFEVGLDPSVISEIVAAIEAGDEDSGLRVLVPRFDFSSAIDLQPSLEALGMVSAFSTAADFSGMDPDGTLFVDSAVHKTTISVDEEGTTAAAASGVVLVPMGVSPQIRLDRPFLFFIYDHVTQSVLFIGRLVRPDGEARAPAEPSVVRTDAETICDGLALCESRTTTRDQCLTALQADDPALLETCADCIQLGVDLCGGLPVCSSHDICQPATCADHCPAHSF